MRKILVSIFCLFCLLLCGCAENEQPEPIVLSGGEFSPDILSITLPVVSDDFPLLDSFTQLQAVDFSGSVCYDEIIAWAESHPQVKVTYSVSLPDGQTVSSDVNRLDLSSMDSQALEDSISILGYLPSVDEIKLPEGLSLRQLQTVSELCPLARLDFSATVSGISVSPELESLDLSKFDSAALQELLPWLSFTKNISSIELGTDSDDSVLSWDEISAVQAACPDAVLNYSFRLYGKTFSLADSEMVLRHIAIDDEGALVKQITACMPNLSHLDMDSCGVSNEAMAEIRDSLPNTNVVWRIWFGEAYTTRTDVERLLASNPGMGGELTAENTAVLKYCTKLKYLDLGHNSYLSDLSFVSYMPDLEVLIVAMANWSDVSPLANCPKLEYAELQTSSLNDLRPLSGLKNLKHLNIAYCFALCDISPLYEMTQLERLWIGCLTPIPQEQIDKFKELVPNCKVNTTTVDPTAEGWRYIGHDEFGYTLLDPRYELLRDQMLYSLGNSAYAYISSDPYYYN